MLRSTKMLAVFAALAAAPAWAQVTIAQQNFNSLSDGGTTVLDSFPAGTVGMSLTNTGSENANAALGMTFDTVWTDSRGNSGPRALDLGSDNSDFIGVNSFAGGAFAPANAPGGAPVASGSEHNFEFNDTDGRTDLVFTPIDASAHSNVQVSFAYWVAPDTFEADDSMTAALADALGAQQVLLTVSGDDLEAIAGAWINVSVPVAGLNLASLQLTISVDNNAGNENIFVDDIAFMAGEGTATPNLIITEILQDPAAVADASGEWFEIYNAGGAPADLAGYTIRDNGSDSHVIASSVVIPAGGYAVLGNNANPATNGGVTVAYQYSGFNLANGDDEVILLDGSLNEIDSVEYDGGPGFPDPTGASMILNSLSNDNNVAANWCVSTSVFGAGDRGTPGAANDSCPVVSPVGSCGDPATLISSIQGPGFSSPVVGSSVVIEGVVVGSFQGANGLGGFFVQEEDDDDDGNALTSEGIFVANTSFPVTPGSFVRLGGTVAESFGRTQINGVSALAACPGTPTVTPASLAMQFPSPALSFLETKEGMAAVLTGAPSLVVSELFNYDRFGEIRVANGDRLEQFTQNNPPSQAGYTAHLEFVNRNNLMIDDGRDGQNLLPLINARSGANYNPATNTLRGGDTAAQAVGVLDFAFSAYRLQPTQPINFQPSNPRPTQRADVGGRIQAASFNVLNFFTTVDAGAPICGPTQIECRGADAAPGVDGAGRTELQRQELKLIQALKKIDADVIGLIELENNYDPVFRNGSPVSAAQHIVDKLNAAGGSQSCNNWSAVDPGNVSVGDDAIAVALIYCANTIALEAGATVEILDDSDLFALGLSGLAPLFTGINTSRAALAATFVEVGTGEAFTAVINHFKSKGDSGLAADPVCMSSPASNPNCDQGDGAGYWNKRRNDAATALAAWLDSDPTGSSDPDFLILGDLNSYAQEDPVQTLLASGYSNLQADLIGPDAYGYVFDAQWGTLDYALANGALATQVTGVTEYHINSDEPDAGDYDFSFNDPSLYDVDEFRTSDHDPVVVGLDLTSETPQCQLSMDLSLDGDRINVDYHIGTLSPAVVRSRAFGRFWTRNLVAKRVDVIDPPQTFTETFNVPKRVGWVAVLAWLTDGTREGTCWDIALIDSRGNPGEAPAEARQSAEEHARREGLR